MALNQCGRVWCEETWLHVNAHPSNEWCRKGHTMWSVSHCDRSHVCFRLTVGPRKAGSHLSFLIFPLFHSELLHVCSWIGKHGMKWWDFMQVLYKKWKIQWTHPFLTCEYTLFLWLSIDVERVGDWRWQDQKWPCSSPRIVRIWRSRKSVNVIFWAGEHSGFSVADISEHIIMNMQL